MAKLTGIEKLTGLNRYKTEVIVALSDLSKDAKSFGLDKAIIIALNLEDFPSVQVVNDELNYILEKGQRNTDFSSELLDDDYGRVLNFCFDKLVEEESFDLQDVLQVVLIKIERNFISLFCFLIII